MKVVAFYGGNITNLAGTERAMFSVANGLAETGNYKVIIISTIGIREDVKYNLHPSIDVVCLNINNYKKQFLKLGQRLINVVKFNKIQYLISVEAISFLFTFYLKFIFGKDLQLILWEHFNFTVNLGLRSRDYARKLAAKFADGIVVLTQRDKELWSKNLSIKGGITSINNPSPFEITPSPYNKESKSIIAIGRYTFQKGFDKLIEIWNQFVKEYRIPSGWKLQIIGQGEDKDLLERLIKNYDLTNVELVGPTSNIGLYYSEASFLVMTSRFEGLPMTLIEAQSYGLPIISFDCLTGPSEVLNNKNGFLIPMDDNENFCKSLNIMILNMGLRERMSDESKIRSQDFAVQPTIKKWEHFLESI